MKRSLEPPNIRHDEGFNCTLIHLSHGHIGLFMLMLSFPILARVSVHPPSVRPSETEPS